MQKGAEVETSIFFPSSQSTSCWPYAFA
jgi:hypothetical protein